VPNPPEPIPSPSPSTAPGATRARRVARPTGLAAGGLVLGRLALLGAAAMLATSAFADAVADAGAPSGLAAAGEAVLERLRGAPPILFFGAFVVATFLPFPIMLFYLVAGATYGIPTALAWIAGALVVSNLIIHTAAKGFLRPILEAIAARRGQTIPRFESGLDEALFITLVRLTPGIPYFVQNVVLAVAHLDLMRFVVLSVAIQMIYVVGFVVLGRSALEGRHGWTVAALALVVAISVAARLIVKRRNGAAGRTGS